jgi:hypothetical protein
VYPSKPFTCPEDAEGEDDDGSNKSFFTSRRHAPLPPRQTAGRGTSPAARHLEVDICTMSYRWTHPCQYKGEATTTPSPHVLRKRTSLTHIPAPQPRITTHTHTPTRTHTHTHTLTHTHTRTRTHIHTHSRSHTPNCQDPSLSGVVAGASEGRIAWPPFTPISI